MKYIAHIKASCFLSPLLIRQTAGRMPTLELQMTFFGLSTFTPFSPRSHNVTNTYILGGATKKSITCNNGWQR